MRSVPYERVSLFREGPMLGDSMDDKASRSSSQTTLRQQVSAGQDEVGHRKFDWKPISLRLWSLALFFLSTVALIGVLEYAAHKLPHGVDGFAALTTSVPHAKRWLVPRDATTQSSDPSSSGSGTVLTGSTPITSAAATPSTAESRTASSLDTSTFSIVTVEQTAGQGDYLATDTTQTVQISSTPTSSAPTEKNSSAEESDYLPTDGTTTISPASSVTPAQPTLTTEESDYLPTDGSTTFTPTSSATSSQALPSTDRSNYLPTGDSTTVSATSTMEPLATTASGYLPTDDSTTIIPTSSSAPAPRTSTFIFTTSSIATVVPVTYSTQEISYQVLSSALVQTTGGQTLTLSSIPVTVAAISTSYSSSVEEVTVTSTSISTPTPGSDGGLADTNGDGKSIVIAQHWSPIQTFLGTYLAVLVGVILRILYTIVYSDFVLIDPFRQMTQAQGASADRAFFSFYRNFSNLSGPIPALMKQRWALAWLATGYLVTSFIPAIGSELIHVDTHWDCPFPIPNSRYPCQPRLAVALTPLRVLEGFLAFTALVILTTAIVLLYSRTGLPADPSSMATIASLMGHPGLTDDLGEMHLGADGNPKAMKQVLHGKRYGLGYWKSISGKTGYGIVPKYHNAGEDGTAGRYSYAPIENTATRPFAVFRSSHRFRLQDFLLAFFILGTFAVVLAYYLDGNQDGFNTFFNSNTFGPRFILTGAGTVIASTWKSVELSSTVMAPYIRLHHQPSSPRSTIWFNPTTTPLVSTFSGFVHGYFLVAAISIVSLLAEALNIVITGIPFAAGETWRQFLVSSYLSLAILGVMILTVIAVIIQRRREPKLPIHPNTLGATMGYLCSTRIVHEYQRFDGEDIHMREQRLQYLGKEYVFQEGVRADGKRAWNVDEVRGQRNSYSSLGTVP